MRLCINGETVFRSADPGEIMIHLAGLHHDLPAGTEVMVTDAPELDSA